MGVHENFILAGDFVIGKVDTTLCECLLPFPRQRKVNLVETMITVQNLSENKSQTLFLTDHKK